MEWVFFIIGIVFITGAGAVIGINFFESDSLAACPIAIIYLVFGIVLILIAHDISLEKTINPIEVYRGNTTLQITYQDGIPVDSVVVLKTE